jgi:hypothetical protein
MVSPDSLGTACPLSGRNSTYRLVQILEAGSTRHVTENWTTALDETATVWARGRVIEDADELWGPRK